MTWLFSLLSTNRKPHVCKVWTDEFNVVVLIDELFEYKVYAWFDLVVKVTTALFPTVFAFSKTEI